MGQKINKRHIPGILLLTLVVVFLFSCGIILFWSQNNQHSVIKVTVESGATLMQIANTLFDNNIIKNKQTFQLAVRLMGKERKIPMGTFNLVNAKSNYDIINQIIYGAPEIKKVRILEGWNINQIADHISKEMNLDRTKIIELCKDSTFVKSNGVNGSSLEGYLFPDTYFFYVGDKPASILKHLIKMNESFWTRNHLIQSKKLNLSKHQIMTLASIIEGEAIYDSERAKISAVYHNRLNIGMRLQADPTIQYIIPDSPRRLLNKDLKIKSPYNTYLNWGLPPGPINSPGKNSILAALYPEKNDFLYFVATGDGYHTFTTNEKDHNRAKRKLQKLRRALKKRENK